MRILLVQRSPIDTSLVRRLVPPETDLRVASSFEEAVDSVARLAPDAVVVNLPPRELPWDDFVSRCEAGKRPVPILFLSAVHSSAEEAGFHADPPWIDFLHTPCPLADLRREFSWLTSAVGEARPVVSSVDGSGPAR